MAGGRHGGRRPVLEVEVDEGRRQVPFFRCEDGEEERVDMCLKNSCKKRVTDMHHEVKHQAVITYYTLVLGQNIDKEEAKRMMLTHEYQLCFDITYVMFDLLMYQLLRNVQVTPWWSRAKVDAWAMEVEKRFTEEYQHVHDTTRERHLMMEGPSHHQGQRSLPEYKELGVHSFFNRF
jgi:hypothetical protein